MHKRRQVLSAAFAAFAALGLFAQTFPDAKSFERSRFDFAFTRADRETDADRWLEEARRALSTARSAWERTAEALYGNAADFARARSEVSDWSEKALEERFAAWLADRFFGREAASLKALVERENADANARYLYRTDAEGNILYDEATGDPLLIRPGDQDAGTVEADRFARDETLRGGADAALGSYSARLEALRPELLSLIAEDRRESFSALLSAAEVAARGRAGRILDAYLVQEERLFIVRRTEDILSLRRKSESEAASSIVEELARATAASCDQGIRNLQARIEDASAGAGDLAVAGSDWLAEFRTQFERGLSAWTEAEESFMARRLEWERDAAIAFNQGNEAWTAAFDRLTIERRAWEDKARALLESGSETFARASESLERSIAEARAEFERDAALRSQASGERARAWVDSYLACGAVVASARDSVEFWLGKIGWNKESDPGLGDSGFSAWFDAKRQALGSHEAFAEIERWTALYGDYLEKARRARDALVGDFGLAIGSGVGELRDVLDPGAASEDFHLDEYQIELLRAKAVAGYWERRVGVAQALADYAAERSAGRATDAESLAAWTAAKAAYDAAARGYEAARSELSAAASGVSAARDAVSAAAEALAEADRVLEELNAEYALKMAVYALGSNDFLKADIAAKYQDLLEQRGLLNGTGSQALYAAYLERAQALGFGETIEYAGELLHEIVAGAAGGISLSEADRRARAIFVPVSSADLLSDPDAYGIDPGDVAYGMIAALLASRAADPARGEAYAELAIRAAGDAKRRAQELVEARLDALALLSAADGRSWYAARNGGKAAGEEFRATLETDILEADRSVLHARILLERDALQAFLDPGSEISGEARFLASFCSLDSVRARDALDALNALASCMAAGAGSAAADFAAEIEGLGIAWPEALRFVRGCTYFSDARGSILSVFFLGDALSAAERARARKSAFERCESASPGLEEERRLAAWNGMRAAISAAGAALPAEGLPTTAAVGAALRADSRGVEYALEALLTAVDAVASSAPSWVAREIAGWRNSLVSYAAVQARSDGQAPSESSRSLETALAAATERRNLIASVLSSLASSDALGIRPLCAALDLGFSDYGGFSRSRIEDEIVRRLSRSLAAAAGSLAALDEAAKRASIEDDAATNFTFAAAELRLRAVEAALSIDAARRASSSGAPPEGLESGARAYRLEEIFSSFDAAALRDTALLAFSPEAAAAYAALAGGSDPSEFGAALSALSAFIAGLRSGEGGASAVKERALSLLLAELSPDEAYLAALLDILPLRGVESASMLRAAASSQEFDLRRESFLGLDPENPYAPEAVRYRLVELLLSGDWSGYDEDRAIALSLPDGNIHLAETDALRALLLSASRYAGPSVSGDALSWARTNNSESAFELADLLLYGRLPASGDAAAPSSLIAGVLRSAMISAIETAYGDAASLGIRRDYAAAYEAAVKAEAEAEAAGRNHWRAYLEDRVADGLDSLPAGSPEGVLAETLPRAAASWKEGVLADSFENAERARTAVSASFVAWRDSIAARNDEGSSFGSALASFRNAAASYIDDPGAAWNGGQVFRVSAAIRDAYETEYRKAIAAYGREAALRTEISRLGGVLDDSSSQETLKAELASLSARISAGRSAYETAMGAYAASAASFAGEGAAYDAAYGNAKSSYAETESARCAYEREDAIRRWSSTSYLAAENDWDASSEYRDPSAELAYARERRARAEIALSSLESLYGEGSGTRPYDDPAYQALYELYRDSFSRLLLTVRARDALMATAAQEASKNQALYEAYIETALTGLSSFAAPIDYKNYLERTDAAEVSWKDLLGLSSGSLRISYDADFSLSTTSSAAAENLVAYFEASTLSGTDTIESTAFERDLRAWASRIAGYGLSGDGFRQWGLARDYLLGKLIARNGQYVGIAGSVDKGDDLLPIAGRSYDDRVTDFQRYADIYGFYSTGSNEDGTESYESYLDRHGLPHCQEQAWNSLSAAEKEDLEFYLALTLASSAGPVEAKRAFELSSKLSVYEDFDVYITGRIDREKRYRNWVWPFYLDYKKFTDIKDRYVDSLKTLSETVNGGGDALANAAADIAKTYTAYSVSSARLAELKGESSGNIAWADIRAALEKTGSFTAAELASLSGYFSQFLASGGSAGNDAASALAALARRERNKRDDVRRDLESSWSAAETRRAAAAAAYRETAARYLEGSADRSELDAAAFAAYGDASPSLKTHLGNLASSTAETAFSQIGSAAVYADLYVEAASDYAFLIERTIRARLGAERSARENEWQILRGDLAEKQNVWQRAASLIIERGLSDWKKGRETLNERYAQWRSEFRIRYEQSDAAWNLAQLQSLAEKETWMHRAAIAADNASKGALLALVGADAEAAARRLDTVAFPLVPPSGVDDAEAAYIGVLSAAGIARLSDAFSGLSGAADAVAKIVRTGLGGASAWDSAKMQVAAAQFVQKTNAELAARQSRMLAAQARKAAEQAVEGLGASVDKANRNFRESMDDTFVHKGRWNRQGMNYAKEVVVHATLWENYITEHAYVEGYIAYAMNPWRLETDLSDSALSELDYRAVHALIERAQNEVKKKSEEVFGTQEELDDESGRTKEIHFFHDVKIGTRIETRIDSEGCEYEIEVPVYESRIDQGKTIKKIWGAGAFGGHIGYDPTLKESPNPNKGLEGIWLEDGAGELGRLLRSYIFWSLKEGKGYAEANKPFYEKGLWDDRDIWFKAPTVRGVVDICVAITAAAVSGGTALPAMLAAAAINLADDALFAFADVSTGYKSWEQAGLDFGKKALSSAANIAVGGAFNGFDGASGFFSGGLSAGLKDIAGLDQVIGRTMLGGLQTFTAGTVASAVNAVHWDGRGLAWSDDAFVAGMSGGLANAAAGMASSFISGSLGRINSANGSLAGFSSGNIDDVGKLNSFLGGLAGQGVNYALTGDFALNLANFSMFGITGTDGRTPVSSGLLEMHFGKNGVAMNIGTGGADSSFGMIASAMGGLSVLGANSWINGYVTENDLDIAVSLRAQYGFGNVAQRAQMWDIVEGRTRLVVDGGDRAGAEAQTKRDERGRVVQLNAYRAGMNIAEQMRLGITLGHEAHRDGYQGNFAEQEMETVSAVYGHSAMMMGMLGDDLYAGMTFGLIVSDSGLRRDAAAYLTFDKTGSRDAFSSYVADAYDSSADYWRILKDKDGNATRVLDDGDREHATIVEVDGRERKVRLQPGSVSAALSSAIGGGMTQPQMNRLMVESGLDWTKETGWYAKDDRARYVEPVAAVAPVRTSLLDGLKSWVATKAQSAGDWLAIRASAMTSYFIRETEPRMREETPRNTFSITGLNDVPVTLYSLGPDNPALPLLSKQHDPAFSDIPDLSASGCNFRVIQAYCELLAGQALTTAQIRQIWNETAGTEIMDTDGFVNKADVLAERTLAFLERSDFGIAFGTDWRKTGTLIGYRIEMPYGKDSHYALGDIEKKIQYNPGNTLTNAIDWRAVYVYPKK